MESNFDNSLRVTKDIMANVISNYKIEGDVNQIEISMHPHISNGMFHRDNSLLEEERFKTLITLARTLDDENIQKVIKNLKYQLTIKETPKKTVQTKNCDKCESSGLVMSDGTISCSNPDCKNF